MIPKWIRINCRKTSERQLFAEKNYLNSWQSTFAFVHWRTRRWRHHRKNFTTQCDSYLSDKGPGRLWNKKKILPVSSRPLISVTDNNEDFLTPLRKLDKLDVTRWVAEAREEIPNIVNARSWNILLDHKSGHKPVWKLKLKMRTISFFHFWKQAPGDVNARNYSIDRK